MSSSSISLSTVSQGKMALHAAKHGHGPIHGILIGTRSSSPTSPASLEVTDAVPVCHEDPTKPIVDMSLRLVDGHLSIKNDGTRIVGWYSANSNAGDDGPSPSARRVASCLSAEEAEGGGCVLLAVSAGRVAACLAGGGPGPICDAYEADAKSGAYTRLVDGTRIASEDDGERLGEVIRSAIRSSGEGEGDVAAGGSGTPKLSICDFVDHLEDCGRGDWIENREAGIFLKNALA